MGHVIRVTVPMSHDQRRNKGFAYVEFKTVEEAKKALKLDGTEFLGRKVMVCQARPKENRSIYTVFCKNLNYSTTKEDLKSHFEKFGKVFNISLPIDPENKERNKGFCFIEYTDRDTVDAVLKAKHTVNERMLYLNEGNKNEERNEKRSNDRLYGRKNDRSDFNSRDRRSNDRFSNDRSNGRFNGESRGRSFRNDNDSDEGSRGKRRFDDRRDGGKFNKRSNDFKGGRNAEKQVVRGNKKVFDDSE